MARGFRASTSPPTTWGSERFRRSRFKRESHVSSGGRRGAQVWAVNGRTITVRYVAEAHQLLTADIDVSLLNDAGVPATVGTPLVVVVNTDSYPYSIVSCEPGTHAAGLHLPDPVASVANGEFHPAVFAELGAVI